MLSLSVASARLAKEQVDPGHGAIVPRPGQGCRTRYRPGDAAATGRGSDPGLSGVLGSPAEYG
ncbi:hypothetical protein Pen02_49850 [Plantactinospora endophytica]|uniref:Uncharacterized protein n=1 Tax=Plantactinospora endophytica TaxID=673535 RepID=A0ABQ4E5U5_9ACTN|nr:hypothetical protein Pen02_49850 [Plantactinospora endophytica]